jgi:hypothetical protein
VALSATMCKQSAFPLDVSAARGSPGQCVSEDRFITLGFTASS